MSELIRDDNFAGRGDDVYALLVEGHEGLSDSESMAMNARLILLLANHIGDYDVLAEAVRLARVAG